MKPEIVLCIPQIKSRKLQDIYPPIGLAYIHASLLTAGYAVRVINLNFHGLNALGRLIKEKTPDFVLSGGTSYDYEALAELFAYVKSVDQNILTIGGGVGYTSEPIVFSELTNVDYAVLGEGEITDVELIRRIQEGKPIGDLSGIVYRNADGVYCQTAPPVPIQDIDTLPFPNYDGFEVERYFQNQKEHGFPRHFSDVDEPRILVMMNSRSCPYQCSFCFHPISYKYRVRNMDAVFREIEENIKKYKINGIFFADELFANNREHVHKFCERIKKLNLRWFIELRVDFVTEDLVTELKASGCVSLLLGLEGYTERILKDMRKGITPAQIKSAVETVYKVGMRMEGHFIFGTPLEDEDSFRDVFTFWQKYRWSGIDIVWLFLYPGTRYYEFACDNKIITDKKQFIISQMPHLNITRMDSETYYRYARIDSLTLLDEDHYGDIFSKTVHDQKCDFELRCPLCGAKFIHRNVPLVDVDKSTGRLSLEIKCDACNRYSFYPIRSKNKRVADVVREQIQSNHRVGYDLSAKLLEQSIRRVGLVGRPEIVEMLKEELDGMNITYMKELLFDPTGQGIELCPDVDAVIIADLLHYQKIERKLKPINDRIHFLSATNLIFNFEYHQQGESDMRKW